MLRPLWVDHRRIVADQLTSNNPLNADVRLKLHDPLNADALKLDHLLRADRRRKLNKLGVAVAEAIGHNNPRRKLNV
jgi:uncharacterized protein (DUF58 family)